MALTNGALRVRCLYVTLRGVAHVTSSRKTTSGRKTTRVEALQRDRAFQEAYQVALKQWLAGLPAVFPAGTYKLRGKPGAVILE